MSIDRATTEIRTVFRRLEDDRELLDGLLVLNDWFNWRNRPPTQKKYVTWPDGHKIGRPTKNEYDIVQDNDWWTADCSPINPIFTHPPPKKSPPLLVFGKMSRVLLYSAISNLKY